jgi:hypothetical protein
VGRLKRYWRIPDSAWAYFSVFLAANALISYASLSLAAKGWIFFFFILLPAVLFFLSTPAAGKKEKPVFQTEIPRLPSLKPVYLALALAAVVFFRFYRLTDFRPWFTGDEGLHGFLAIHLSLDWCWRFFYTVGEHPPLLIWLAVPFFKFFQSPFFNLWFLPACLSVLAVPFGYLASRAVFSRTLSLAFGLLMAFSFWPLYFGRFNQQGVFTPFWELSSLWLLALLIKNKKPGTKKWLALILGLWAGLGLLTFTAWMTVILLVALTVAALYWKKSVRDKRPLGFFGAGLAAALLPFLVAALKEGYGHHLIDASSASKWFPAAHQWLTHISYVTCLFWGTLQKGTSYGPEWGGMLNPVLGSCFFLGALELWRLRKSLWAKWLALALVICLLPGFIAADYVELNRVIQVMPFLLIVAAIGAVKLARETPRHRALIVAALFFLSFALDLNHLLKPNVNGPAWRLEFNREIPDENFQAYRALKEAEDQLGAGLIFTDFMLLSHNHTLNVSTYHLNAALNPSLNPEKARWAAVIVNVHYRPFLEKRFPGSQWQRVTPLLVEDGGTVVGIIPVTRQNQDELMRWTKVHRYFHDLNFQAECILNSKKEYAKALEELPLGHPKVQGDAFLESCFGEWVAQYHYGADYEINRAAIRKAISEGYPAAHLYFKLGNLYFLDGRMKEARKAYEAALACRHTETTRL